LINALIQQLYSTCEIILLCLHFTTVGEGIVFGLFVRCVRSSRQTLLQSYLMNGLSSLDKTYREYTLARSYEVIRFWRSKVKVTAGHGCQILCTPYLMNYFSYFDETLGNNQ